MCGGQHPTWALQTTKLSWAAKQQGWPTEVKGIVPGPLNAGRREGHATAERRAGKGEGRIEQGSRPLIGSVYMTGKVYRALPFKPNLELEPTETPRCYM